MNFQYIWVKILELSAPAVYAKKGDPVKITNPISATSVTDLLINIISWLLGIAAILAMLAFVVGAVRFIISFGREQEVVAAKKVMVWALIGFGLIILAFVIVNIIPRVLGGLA